MRFTAFVDEYYYETSPTDPSETAVNGLWKKFVNQQARVMNILSNLAYSPDRQSTKTNAIYSIRQSSIQTMYNIMDEENFTAWGTEMIRKKRRSHSKKHERRFQPDIQRLEQRTCEYAPDVAGRQYDQTLERLRHDVDPPRSPITRLPNTNVCG